MIVRELGATFGAKRSGGTTSMVAGLTCRCRSSIRTAARSRARRPSATWRRSSSPPGNAWLARSWPARTRRRACSPSARRCSRARPNGRPSLLARADEARRIALGAYREGAVPLLQVIDAARAWGEARLTFYETAVRAARECRDAPRRPRRRSVHRTSLARSSRAGNPALTETRSMSFMNAAVVSVRRPATRGPRRLPHFGRCRRALVLLGMLAWCARKGCRPRRAIRREGATADTATVGRESHGWNGQDAAPRGRRPTPPHRTSEVTLTAAQIRHGQRAWQPVTMGTSSATVTVPGQIVPNEDRTARLGAPAAGRVVAVPLAPGRPVARGQILVTLQSPEAGAAQSDLAKARGGARRRVARRRRTRRARASAPSDCSRSRRFRGRTTSAPSPMTSSPAARVTQAEAELTRARSSAEQLGATASASGEIALRSPLAGVVLARTAVPGTVVDAGAPLVVVTDPTIALAHGECAGSARRRAFATGTTLRFSVPAYPARRSPRASTPSAPGSIPGRARSRCARASPIAPDGSSRRCSRR